MPARCISAGCTNPATLPWTSRRSRVGFPEQGSLTRYQVNLLCKGHADGFFLQHYKILERLGKGRMAGVYKAVHDLGQVVALKVLPPSRAKIRTCSSASSASAARATSQPPAHRPRVSNRRGRRALLLGDGAPRRGNPRQRPTSAGTVSSGRGRPAGLPGLARAATYSRAGPGPPRSEAGQSDDRADGGAGGRYHGLHAEDSGHRPGPVASGRAG